MPKISRYNNGNVPFKLLIRSNTGKYTRKIWTYMYV